MRVGCAGRGVPGYGSRLISLSCKIALLVGTGIAGSLASSLAVAADQERVIEEIVVTGSNIRRRQDFETPSPVQTLGQEEIGDTGAARIQDVFKGLTVNSGSQIANRQNELQGLSQFSLRGLGVGSTLTLVNSRRAGLAPATDSSGQLFTDINQFLIYSREMILRGSNSPLKVEPRPMRHISLVPLLVPPLSGATSRCLPTMRNKKAIPGAILILLRMAMNYLTAQLEFLIQARARRVDLIALFPTVQVDFCVQETHCQTQTVLRPAAYLTATTVDTTS